MGTVIGGTWVGWEVGCMVMVGVVSPQALVIVVCAVWDSNGSGADHLA